MLLKPAAVRSALSVERDMICSRCLARLARPSALQTLHRSSIHTKRKLHGSIVPDREVQQHMTVTPQAFIHDYFSANSSIDRGWVKSGILAAWRTFADSPKPTRPTQDGASRIEAGVSNSAVSDFSRHHTVVVEKRPAFQHLEAAPSSTSSGHTPDREHVLPHRRRKVIRDANTESEAAIPLDASSQLTAAATALPSSALIRRRMATYLSLTKPRLSFLIVLTAAAGYGLYPVPEILSSANDVTSSTLSTSTLTLSFLTLGTFLSSACANTLNMLAEPKSDALMSRTRNRPLVRKLISPRAATLFAVVCGTTGLVLLDLGTNSTVAALSALNIFLYAGVYTSMKRVSVLNTWAGAIVGGIPPLMGWAAAAGQAATSEHHGWQDLLLSEDSIGGWLVAALLFAWQFPHFNALSFAVRDEYKRAGHKMLCWVNPAMNARVALRYSLAMFPICGGLWWSGVVNSGFLAISTVCNVWMTREAVRFWRQAGAGGSARGLFWASLWHLPLVLVGALVCKRGIYDGFWDKETPANDALEEMEDEENAAMDARSGQSRKHKTLADINLAMMGFKRPS